MVRETRSERKQASSNTPGTAPGPATSPVPAPTPGMARPSPSARRLIPALAPGLRVDLILVLPSKGMVYGAPDYFTGSKTDATILAALQRGCVGRPSYHKLSTGISAELKADVDDILAEMFQKASAQPLVSTLRRDNDGLQFLTQLQAQTIWAQHLEPPTFEVLFQSLVKAHKTWEASQNPKGETSETADAIAGFLKVIGSNKWAGLDAEIELLKFTSGFE